MSVPVAGDTARAIGIIESRLWPSAVARPGERRLEFAFDHRLNELAHPTAQAGFDRVKPVIEKTNRGLGFQLQGQRLRAIAGHGVVSTRRANAEIVWASPPKDYANSNSNHAPDRSGRFGSIVSNFYAIVGRTVGLLTFTPTYFQANVVIPYIIVP